MTDTRHHVSENLFRDYERLRESVVAIPLYEWSLIELSGDDRLDWLQGQATNDVRGLTPGQRLSFCLCEPTGQILAPVDAWALKDRILMAVPHERSEAVLERVERMTILEDVAARSLDGEYEGVSYQGPHADQVLVQTFDLPADEAGQASSGPSGSPVLLLRSDRTGEGGWDVWRPRNAPSLTTVAEASSGAIEAVRIEAGIPKWGVDLGAKTLPPELGHDFEARHVSYAKGCYTGQEVLMRMHSRGHTNRTWIGLVAKEPFHVGEEVMHDGKPVGTVSSAAFSPTYGSIGAATLRNEATQAGTLVRVGSVEAEVRQMPLRRKP